MYIREEQLKISQRIGVTKECYDILREQKKEQKLSMAKIVCNLILKVYNKEENK